MDHQPPPFFNRGPAPLALLTFYVALSLALLIADARLQALEMLRQGLSLFTHPVQNLAHLPGQLVDHVSAYFVSLARLQEENAQLKRSRLENVSTLLRTQQLETENQRLRKLLELKERPTANGQIAEILFSARDPYSRRVVIDKGLQDHVQAGQPVIDDAGVVGQVTRVFPFVSEVTLITDKEQSVPVQIVRTGQRSVIFGLGNGQLELRFMPAHTDVQNGDLLVTSGLDGVYLAGFPVAKVVRIDREVTHTFARIFCLPVAGVENFGAVMIMAPRPTVVLPESLAKQTAVNDRKAAPKAGQGRKKRSKKE